MLLFDVSKFGQVHYVLCFEVRLMKIDIDKNDNDIQKPLTLNA